jgi:hypothetical protein
MGFPIFDINIRKTRDQQFKLLFSEDGNQFSGNDVVEAFNIRPI